MFISVWREIRPRLSPWAGGGGAVLRGFVFWFIQALGAPLLGRSGSAGLPQRPVPQNRPTMAVGNRGEMARMQTSDNTRSGGPIQPGLTQQRQANRCPISAANSSLKIFATPSCSLANGQSTFRGWREDVGEGRKVSSSVLNSGLEKFSAGWDSVGRVAPTTLSPTTLSPTPG